MSKGSTQRPRKVKKSQFDENWEKIFGKPGQKKPPKKS